MVSQPAQTDNSLSGTQHEGESRSGNMLDTIDKTNKKSVEQETNISNKQKWTDKDETHLPRRSTRPKVVRDYWALNEPAPELSEEENDDLPEIS